MYADTVMDQLEPIDSPESEELEIARSSFADMLHDTERNEKYKDALILAINKMHSLGKTARVLDIGTGSGLLSMFAASCGADSVVACEAFKPIVDCARQVLKVNGFDEKIKVIPKHSTLLTVGEEGDLSEKANILVAELFDTELIGEGALSSFSHAYQNLLDDDCIVIPSFGVIYAQVVESTEVQNWNKLKDLHNTNGELLIKVPDYIKSCAGTAAVHDLQLSQLPTNKFTQICPPQAVFHFDWSGRTPLIFNEKKNHKLIASCDGTAQMVFMWWELAMDPDKTITLSCAPYWAHPARNIKPDLTSSDIPWRDHWLQAVYYLPTEISVKNGQELNLISCHDEYSVWFYLQDTVSNLSNEYTSLICECGVHAIHSRTRIGQLNDDMRRHKYSSFLKKHVTNESVILLLGNGFYYGLAATKLGAKKLLFLEENKMFASILKAFILENYITNCDILESVDCLKTHPNVNEVSLILGEPFFDCGILPWDHILFSKKIQSIKEFVRRDVVVAPKQCIIKYCLVEFVDLQKIRFPVEVCGEFDMAPFDTLIEAACSNCDPNVDVQPLWEYPCIAKTLPAVLATLNMYDIHSSNIISDSSCIKIESPNKNYNAIAFWTEWNFDGSEECMVSTGPTVPPIVGERIQWDVHAKQGVKFVQPKCSKGTSISADYTSFERSTL